MNVEERNRSNRAVGSGFLAIEVRLNARDRAHVGDVGRRH